MRPIYEGRRKVGKKRGGKAWREGRRKGISTEGREGGERTRERRA